MNVASRKWMAIALGLTLVLGMSIGIVLDRSVLGVSAEGSRRVHRGEGGRGRFLARLTAELGLSAEQQATLEGTLSTNREEAHAFWQEARQAFSKLREEYREQIRALLDPDQRVRFEEILAEEEARHRRRGRR